MSKQKVNDDSRKSSRVPGIDKWFISLRLPEVDYWIGQGLSIKETASRMLFPVNEVAARIKYLNTDDYKAFKTDPKNAEIMELFSFIIELEKKAPEIKAMLSADVPVATIAEKAGLPEGFIHAMNAAMFPEQTTVGEFYPEGMVSKAEKEDYYITYCYMIFLEELKEMQIEDCLENGFSLAQIAKKMELSEEDIRLRRLFSLRPSFQSDREEYLVQQARWQDFWDSWGNEFLEKSGYFLEALTEGVPREKLLAECSEKDREYLDYVISIVDAQ